MSSAATKRAAAKAIFAAKRNAPKGVSLVDFREPTAAERRKGRELESLARQCLKRNGQTAA